MNNCIVDSLLINHNNIRTLIALATLGYTYYIELNEENSGEMSELTKPLMFNQFPLLEVKSNMQVRGLDKKP